MPSHAGNRGSTPLGTTINKNKGLIKFTGPFFFSRSCHPPHYPPHIGQKGFVLHVSSGNDRAFAGATAKPLLFAHCGTARHSRLSNSLEETR
jgi:hypothetical protein